MKPHILPLKSITTLFALAAIAISVAFPFKASAQYAGAGTFIEITSVSDLTDGYYVIANSSGAFAMDSAHTGSLYPPADIAPVSGTLVDPPAGIVWRIETNGAGRTIFSEVTSRYASYTGSSNNIQAVDAVSSDNQRWNFAYASNLFVVTNVALTTRTLRYNASSPRFVCYATSFGENLRLYKLTSIDPTAPAITTTGAFTPFATFLGSASASQSMTVEGANLTESVLATAPANFEVSGDNIVSRPA
jgi:hypothetical protein